MSLLLRYMSRTKEYVEALIFAFGDGISLDELKKKTKTNDIIVKKVVSDLNSEYRERKSAIEIVTEGSLYRMRLRPELIFLVEENLRTDLGKGVLMTLSLIALRGKITQKELIKTRGSIAYQHVKYLVSRGLITTQRDGNTKTIKISPLFYDYFDIKSTEFKELKEKVKEEVTKESSATVEYQPN